ncbi:MAG: hypothetical protein Q4D68_02565 [Moraxella equi]|nr:hypothetical protein [Moraxella equi]
MAIGPITIGALIGGGVAGAALKMKEVFNGEAAHYWGSDTAWNDSSDAFRHAYVSARFAQMTGEHTANILGMFNEVISKSEAISWSILLIFKCKHNLTLLAEISWLI